MEHISFENPKIKDKVTVLQLPEDTGGEYMLLEVELKAGGGNDLHYHTSFTEEFFPVSGILGIELDGKPMKLLPGQTALVPKNAIHRFFNSTNETIRFKVKIAPANEGFLQSLQIGYGLAADNLTNAMGIPKNINHLAVLLKLADTRLTGWKGFLSNLLLRRAERLKRKGVLDKLVRKYCVRQ